jgi:dolichol kinase
MQHSFDEPPFALEIIILVLVYDGGSGLAGRRMGICYYRIVRELRVARAFVALICIAVLLWCTAADPSAAHLQLALPALVFCFFAVLRLSLLRVSDGSSAVQPISFLTLHISRAPPLA